MKKNILKKVGVFALLGINVSILASVEKNAKPQVYTKISTESVNKPGEALLAAQAGGGAFWQGAGGAAGALLGGAAGVYLGGPWGGYIGTVLGGGAGAW